MNSELYKKLFNKLDSLGAIRKDLTFGCEYIVPWDTSLHVHISKDTAMLPNWVTYPTLKPKKIFWHPPVLSDCLKAINKWKFWIPLATTVLMECDLSKPLLSDQSDELGEYLLTLLG